MGKLMRNIIRLAVLTVALLAGVVMHRGYAADISALIKSLDRTEWEIVSSEVKKRLPDLIATEEEQASFKKMLESSQKAAALAEALQAGDYETVQKISTQYLADNLEGAVATRFGTESRLYQSIQLLKKDRNRELAKKLTKAALDVNPEDAKSAIQGFLTEHASSHYQKLQGMGEKFWKDMLLEVIPGGTKLASYGFNPVDIYIQQVRDFSNFTAATRESFNDAMLNCQAKLYREVITETGSHQIAVERLEIFGSSQGKRGFECDDEPGSNTMLGNLTNWLTNLGSGAAVGGELKLSPGEIAALAQTYGQKNGQKGRGRKFARWVREQLEAKVTERANNLTDAIDAEQERVANIRRSEMNNVMAAIEAEIAKLDRGKKGQRPPAGPDGESKQPVAGGQGQDPKKSGRTADGGGGAGKEKPEPPKVTVQCDKFTSLTASVERGLRGGQIGDPSSMIAELSASEAAARSEGNCGADIFAAAAKSRGQLQQISALRQKIRTAISACNVDAASSLKGEAARLPGKFFENEKSLLETMQTGVSAFKRGRAAYDGGKYAPAKRDLQRSLDAFRELPSGACDNFAGRARDGLDIIGKIEKQQARVSRAITRCDTDELKKILTAYKTRKHRFYKSAIARINAALPKCEKNDRIIAEGKFCDTARAKLDSARADFGANRLDAAERKLKALDAALKPEKTKRCTELKGSVKGGLSNIGILRTEEARLQQAISACKVDQLDQLKGHYLTRDHPWYDEASIRARGAMHDCRTREAVDADDRCRREAKLTGKVFAGVDYKENGNHKCQFCERGYKREGNVCVPDRASAEANCRRMAIQKGKVYAKTEMHNNGTSTCHWCEPGQVYNNGKCGTLAAHNELKCRRMAAQKGKVYARTQVLANGRLNCHWCEPGQFYRNGQCHSRVVRTCPNGYVLRGTRCYPRGGGGVQQGGGGGTLYRCTYNNPDGSLLGGGGSTSTINSPRPIPGARCVRVR